MEKNTKIRQQFKIFIRYTYSSNKIKKFFFLNCTYYVLKNLLQIFGENYTSLQLIVHFEIFLI